MFEQPTLPGMAPATSSPASEALRSDCGSPGCPTTSPSGPAGGRASPSASPGSARAARMTATSGRSCIAFLSKRDPLGSLARTLLASSRWSSMACWLTWRARATPRGRLLFQLAPSMPRTDATGSGSSPATGREARRSEARDALAEAGGRSPLPEGDARFARRGDALADAFGEGLEGRAGAGRDAAGERSPAQRGGAVLPDAGCRSGEGPRHEERAGSAQARWLAEPRVGRLAVGVPARVAKLRALGNAVVPQVVAEIGRAILSEAT
jgi:hypothetical protein